MVIEFKMIWVITLKCVHLKIISIFTNLAILLSFNFDISDLLIQKEVNLLFIWSLNFSAMVLLFNLIKGISQSFLPTHFIWHGARSCVLLNYKWDQIQSYKKCRQYSMLSSSVLKAPNPSVKYSGIPILLWVSCSINLWISKCIWQGWCCTL